MKSRRSYSESSLIKMIPEEFEIGAVVCEYTEMPIYSKVIKYER